MEGCGVGDARRMDELVYVSRKSFRLIWDFLIPGPLALDPSKQGLEKLAFTCFGFSLSEMRLFNGLHAISAKKFLAFLPRTPKPGKRPVWPRVGRGLVMG